MSELDIAKENIRLYKKSGQKQVLFEYCSSHKSSCQRFLDIIHKAPVRDDLPLSNKLNTYMNKVAADLKSAIKLYEENNI